MSLENLRAGIRDPSPQVNTIGANRFKDRFPDEVLGLQGYIFYVHYSVAWCGSEGKIFRRSLLKNQW